MGARRILFQRGHWGNQEGLWRTEVPQQGSGENLGEDLGAKPLEADDTFSK